MSSAVNSPSHYKRGGHELADVIDAFDLDRWETQAAQYLFRAKHKDDGAHEDQDLAKTMAFVIRALLEKYPARLESFEAFGFRLVRAAVPLDQLTITGQPKRLVPRDAEPGADKQPTFVTLAQALKRVPADDFDGDASTAVMNARTGHRWLGSSGADVDVVLADLDPDAPIVAALRKAADGVRAGDAA